MLELNPTAVALLESIATEQTALGEILNTQADFLKKGLSLDDLDPCKLLELNESVVLMIEAAVKMENVLKEKMEFVVKTFSDASAEFPSDEEEDG